MRTFIATFAATFVIVGSANATAVVGSTTDPVYQGRSIMCGSVNDMETYIGIMSKKTGPITYAVIDEVNAALHKKDACALRSVMYEDGKFVERVVNPSGTYKIYRTKIISELRGGVATFAPGKERFLYFFLLDGSEEE